MRYTRSTIVAMPMPPPMHSVTRPVARSRRSSSSSTVPISIAPVAPSGWPSAIAPPLTFTFAGSIAEVAHRLERDGGEGLVDLPQVDVRTPHARLASSALRLAGRRRGEHDDRLGSRRGHRAMRARGCRPCACAILGRRDQHRAGAVDDAARVAGVVHVLDRRETCGYRAARMFIERVSPFSDDRRPGPRTTA